MTKALGMTVYVAANTTTSAVYTTLCATSVEGGGVEANVETLEPCLSDTVILEYPADPKYSQLTVTYKKVESTNGSGTVTYTLEDACLAATLIPVAVSIPLATTTYATKHCYVISHNDDPKERNQDMTSTVVLAPQTDWTYSTSQPATA